MLQRTKKTEGSTRQSEVGKGGGSYEHGFCHCWNISLYPNGFYGIHVRSPDETGKIVGKDFFDYYLIRELRKV